MQQSRSQSEQVKREVTKHHNKEVGAELVLTVPEGLPESHWLFVMLCGCGYPIDSAGKAAGLEEATSRTLADKFKTDIATFKGRRQDVMAALANNAAVKLNMAANLELTRILANPENIELRDLSTMARIMEVVFKLSFPSESPLKKPTAETAPRLGIRDAEAVSDAHRQLAQIQADRKSPPQKQNT